MTSLRRRDAQSITLSYDKLNRLLSRSYSATADNITFGYDLVNRRTASNFADSSYTIAYVWDNAGRLTSAAANGPAVGSKTLSYQYDAAGNRTRITWPAMAPGRMATMPTISRLLI